MGMSEETGRCAQGQVCREKMQAVGPRSSIQEKVAGRSKIRCAGDPEKRKLEKETGLAMSGSSMLS